MPLPIAGIIGGATQIVGSLIGRGKRRREARAAAREYEQQKSAFQDYSFENKFSGLENVYEDLTVNQQASQFQAQQTDQALAQSLQTAAMTGGGVGGAQAIAQAALQSKQGISKSIAQQEQQNQALRAQEESKLQFRSATAADDMQLRQYDQTQQLLNMASGRKNSADAARRQATQALVGGIGSIAGGVATAGFSDGGFMGNLTKNFGGSDSSEGPSMADLKTFFTNLRK